MLKKTTNEIKFISLTVGIILLAVVVNLFGQVVPTNQLTSLWLRASAYMNWGQTRGTSGYGIRDNAGNIEVKNSGGSWGTLNPATVTGGSCTNQVATAISVNGVPTCTTVTSAYADSSLAAVASGNLFTALQTITRNALVTTSTDGVLIQNATPATNGVPVQISPRIRLAGTAWDTSASQTVAFFWEVLPANAATPTGTAKLGYSLNGAAASYPATVSSAGTLGITGSMNTGGSIVFGGGSTTQLDGATNGELRFKQNNGSTGISLNVLTTDTLTVRNLAQNAYGTVDALAYKASGTAITSGTTHLSAGSGMAVANVGANSCGTSTATIAGNNNASVTTVGATSGTQCRIQFTIAATTEWDCAANDDTTTVAVRTTPVDTTHTDIIGAFTAGDKVTAICFPR